MKSLAQTIATALSTLERLDGTNHQSIPFWEDILENMKSLLPSGSGIDSGTEIDEHDCTSSRLVLSCSFHHMNDGGYYSGWTDHKIICTPDWEGITVEIEGEDRDQIHDYLGDTFHACLSQDVSDLHAQIAATHFPKPVSA